MLRVSLSALSGFVLACATARSCDCPRIGPDDALARATLVADIRVAKLKRITGDVAEGRAKVVKAWKGAAPGQYVRFRFEQRNSCASGLPKLNTVFRVATGRAPDGIFEPAVCFAVITRPENEPVLDAYARAGSQRD